MQLMKRVVAVLVVFALFTGTVFAAPLSPAGSIDTVETPRVEVPDFAGNDLFADVRATALATEEAQAVEGEGWFNALISGIVGGIVGSVSGASVSLGVLTIPGLIAGAVGGAASSAAAAYPTNDIVLKGSIK
jgi:hypothetical protein